MYEDLVRRLREHAEWARGNEWETPLCLEDDLLAAADAIEGLESDNSALRIKQKMSAARTSCQLNPQEQCQVWQENRQLQAERDAAVEDLHKLVPAWRWDGTKDDQSTDAEPYKED